MCPQCFSQCVTLFYIWIVIRLKWCQAFSYPFLEEEIHKDSETADQDRQYLAKVVVHIFRDSILLLTLHWERRDDFFCERRKWGGFTIADYEGGRWLAFACTWECRSVEEERLGSKEHTSITSGLGNTSSSVAHGICDTLCCVAHGIRDTLGDTTNYNESSVSKSSCV